MFYVAGKFLMGFFLVPFCLWLTGMYPHLTNLLTESERWQVFIFIFAGSVLLGWWTTLTEQEREHYSKED